MFVWGTENPRPVRSVLSRRLHSELLLPEGRIDLAVLDLRKVRLAVNSKGKFGYIQLEPGQHIFIEIKASRTNRSNVSSRDRWKRLISADIEKLSAYPHPCVLVCFDFSRLLDDSAVQSLTKDQSANVEILYIRNDIGDCLFREGGPNETLKAMAKKRAAPERLSR